MPVHDLHESGPSEKLLRQYLVPGKSVLIRNQWWTITGRDLDAGNVKLSQSEWAIKDGAKRQGPRSMKWTGLTAAIRNGTYGVKLGDRQYGPTQDREARAAQRKKAGLRKAPGTASEGEGGMFDAEIAEVFEFLDGVTEATLEEKPMPAVVKAWAKKTGVSVQKAYSRYKRAGARVSDQYPDVPEESDRWYALKIAIFKTMMGLKGATEDVAALGSLHFEEFDDLDDAAPLDGYGADCEWGVEDALAESVSKSAVSARNKKDQIVQVTPRIGRFTAYSALPMKNGKAKPGWVYPRSDYDDGKLHPDPVIDDFDLRHFLKKIDKAMNALKLPSLEGALVMSRAPKGGLGGGSKSGPSGWMWKGSTVVYLNRVPSPVATSKFAAWKAPRSPHTMVHEYGHTIWYSVLSGAQRAAVTAYFNANVAPDKKAAKAAKTTPTTYGATKVEEWWAECIGYAMYGPGERISVEVFDFLRDVLSGKATADDVKPSKKKAKPKDKGVDTKGVKTMDLSKLGKGAATTVKPTGAGKEVTTTTPAPPETEPEKSKAVQRIQARDAEIKAAVGEYGVEVRKDGTARVIPAKDPRSKSMQKKLMGVLGLQYQKPDKDGLMGRYSTGKSGGVVVHESEETLVRVWMRCESDLDDVLHLARDADGVEHVEAFPPHRACIDFSTVDAAHEFIGVASQYGVAESIGEPVEEAAPTDKQWEKGKLIARPTIPGTVGDFKEIDGVVWNAVRSGYVNRGPVDKFIKQVKAGKWRAKLVEGYQPPKVLKLPGDSSLRLKGAGRETPLDTAFDKGRVPAPFRKDAAAAFDKWLRTQGTVGRTATSGYVARWDARNRAVSIVSGTGGRGVEFTYYTDSGKTDARMGRRSSSSTALKGDTLFAVADFLTQNKGRYLKPKDVQRGLGLRSVAGVMASLARLANAGKIKYDERKRAYMMETRTPVEELIDAAADMLDEVALDEDVIVALGALGSVAPGGVLGKLAVGLKRAVQDAVRLHKDGKESAAEKAWAKIDPNDRKRVKALLKRYEAEDSGSLPTSDDEDEIEVVIVEIADDEVPAYCELFGLCEVDPELGKEIGSGKAALHTNPSGEKFWGAAGAGILPICPKTGRFLLGKRSRAVNEPNTWGLFGGAMDKGEDPMQAARRELIEELGYRGPVKIHKAFVFTSPGGGFVYHNFLGVVEDEFVPKLDWENSRAEWLTMRQAEKIKGRWHFGFEALVMKSRNAITKLLGKAGKHMVRRKHESRWQQYADARGVPLEEAQFEVSDRYTALGIPHPDPETMCDGHCEGTGWVPVYMAEGDKRDDPKLARVSGPDEDDPRLITLWHMAEEANPADDGWHFVLCPDCNGSRLREAVATAGGGWKLRTLSPGSHLNTTRKLRRVEVSDPGGGRLFMYYEDGTWTRRGIPGVQYPSSFFKPKPPKELGIPLAVSKRAKGLLSESVDEAGFRTQSKIRKFPGFTVRRTSNGVVFVDDEKAKVSYYGSLKHGEVMWHHETTKKPPSEPFPKAVLRFANNVVKALGESEEELDEAAFAPLRDASVREQESNRVCNGCNALVEKGGRGASCRKYKGRKIKDPDGLTCDEWVRLRESVDEVQRTTFGELAVGDRYAKPNRDAVYEKTSKGAAKLIKATTGKPGGVPSRVRPTETVIRMGPKATHYDPYGLHPHPNNVIPEDEDDLDEAQSLTLQVWPKGQAATGALSISTRTPLKRAAQDVLHYVGKHKPAWLDGALNVVEYAPARGKPTAFAFDAEKPSLRRLRESEDELDEGFTPKSLKVGRFYGVRTTGGGDPGDWDHILFVTAKQRNGTAKGIDYDASTNKSRKASFNGYNLSDAAQLDPRDVDGTAKSNIVRKLDSGMSFEDYGESVDEGYQHVHWKGSKSLRFKIAVPGKKPGSAAKKTVQGRTFGEFLGIHMDNRGQGTWVVTHIPTGLKIVGVSSLGDERGLVRAVKSVEQRLGSKLDFATPDEAPADVMAALKNLRKLRESEEDTFVIVHDDGKRYWTGDGWTTDITKAKQYDSEEAAAKAEEKIGEAVVAFEDFVDDEFLDALAEDELLELVTDLLPIKGATMRWFSDHRGRRVTLPDLMARISEDPIVSRRPPSEKEMKTVLRYLKKRGVQKDGDGYVYEGTTSSTAGGFRGHGDPDPHGFQSGGPGGGPPLNRGKGVGGAKNAPKPPADDGDVKRGGGNVSETLLVPRDKLDRLVRIAAELQLSDDLPLQPEGDAFALILPAEQAGRVQEALDADAVA